MEYNISTGVGEARRREGGFCITITSLGRMKVTTKSNSPMKKGRKLLVDENCSEKWSDVVYK